MNRRRGDLAPLEILDSPEKNDFRLGAGGIVSSATRCRVPVGLGGRLGECCMSLVPADVPGLMSQQAMRYLGTTVDTAKGEVHFTSLDTTSPLFITGPGHLAIRIDEWPADMSARLRHR